MYVRLKNLQEEKSYIITAKRKAIFNFFYTQVTSDSW